MYGLMLLALISTVSADESNFRPCKRNREYETVNIHRVRLNPCEKVRGRCTYGNRLPNITIEIDFTPNIGSSGGVFAEGTMIPFSRSRLLHFYQYRIMSYSDACITITCPLVANTTQTYTYSTGPSDRYILRRLGYIKWTLTVEPFEQY